MVRSNILKSSAKDHLSMYCRSSVIQVSKFVLLRPLTCHSPVIPGVTLKRLISHASDRRATSRSDIGRGPTNDISPLRTLHSCGRSSRKSLPKIYPIHVTLTARFILKIHPDTH